MFSKGLSGLSPNSGFSSVIDNEVAKDIIIQVTGNNDSESSIDTSSKFKKTCDTCVISGFALLISSGPSDAVIINEVNKGMSVLDRYEAIHGMS